MLKNLQLVLAIYLLSMTASSAQRFYSVVFSKLPQDYQLYPRNSENEAVVPVSGFVETADWKYMSVIVTRNNAPYKYLRANITYQNGKGSFSTETKIKAELAGYDFKVYVCKDADSVLMVNRQQVVSGDVYVLSGQSNSTGFFTESDTNRFCRTFGKITDNLNTTAYNAADTLWALSNMKPYDTGVGTMGFEIQKQLMQTSGIPNCLINAGWHWSSASGHATRTENNPTDFNNGYGRMLYRIQKGGLTNAVKAYLFRQGETEAYHEGFNWEENFARLRTNLKTDLPNLQKLYVFQIDIIYFPSPVGAEVRDYQRRLPTIYPDTRSLATVGTQEFDGLHYGHAGNVQSGQEVSRLISRDFYGSKDTLNINSPTLKKAFYSNSDKKQMILLFDEGQELVYPESYKPNANVTLDMKDFFFLDGWAGRVASGKADGNQIILELTGSQGATSLNYLPMYLEEGGPYFPFTGPYIKNKRGMRAFTVNNMFISIGLKTPTLTATETTDKNIKLTWEAVTDAVEFALERKAPGSDSYVPLARLKKDVLEFTDKPASFSGSFSYRLKAIGGNSDSPDYGYAEFAYPVILGVEKDPDALFSVFPNPAIKDQPVKIHFKNPVNGTVTLLNVKGQHISGQDVKLSQDVFINMPAQSSGLHVIKFETGDKVWTKKILLH